MAMDGEFKFDPIYESSESVNTLYENNTSVLLEVEDCHLNARLDVNGSTITSLENDATYEWVTFNKALNLLVLQQNPLMSQSQDSMP